MGTLIESFKFGTGASAGYRLIDYFAGATQDERIRSRDRMTELSYRKERDLQMDSITKEQFESNLAEQRYENFRQREFTEAQNYEDRRNQREIQEGINKTNIHLAELDNDARKYEADQARIASESSNRTQLQIAVADFDLRNSHHQERLRHEEEIAERQLSVQMNIARQSRELEKYLSDKKQKCDKEIARFNALAYRETQILVARENAANIMQDRFVQEALKDFPLNVSPIVLLRNRPHSLGKLLAFTNSSVQDIPIEEVYEEVQNYALSPEALNIFIAPVHLNSGIMEKNNLSIQLWDTVYQHIESFFDEYYNRNSSSPVLIYPTAWKKDLACGSHAAETMYYFLRDMPCLLLEPKFDGNVFSVMVSAWGLGYETREHIRSEIRFESNIDILVARAAYDRSKRSLKILSKLNDNLNEELSKDKTLLQQNINYYESLKLEKADDELISDLSAIGINRLFNLIPMQDIKPVSQNISNHLSVIIAILTDIHHLKATNADIRFPEVFKSRFPELFSKKEFREKVYRWYESVYIRLRSQDNHMLSNKHSVIMSKVRESQIRNLAFTLELIDKKTFLSEVDSAVIDYAKTKYNFESTDMEDVWWKCIDGMTEEDLPFFEQLKEKLPRNDTHRKRIVNKISDLK